MNHAIIENLLLPSLTRLGTIVAGGLIGYGVSAEHTDNIVLGGISIVLVGIDFAFSYVRRKVTERKAVENGK